MTFSGVRLYEPLTRKYVSQESWMKHDENRGFSWRDDWYSHRAVVLTV